MSQYESSTTTVVATPSNRELIEQYLAANVGSPVVWTPSRTIMSARQQLAEASANGAQALDLSAFNLPAPSAASPFKALGAFASTVSGACATMSRNDVVALDADLASLLAATRRAERETVFTLTQRALQTRGFSTRAGSSADRAAIEARREHSVVLIAVHDGGELDIDWAGHAGSSCESEVDEIRAALAAEGLEVTIRRVERHANPSGGSMIAQAARAGDGDLLEGLLDPIAGRRQSSARSASGAPQRERGRG